MIGASDHRWSTRIGMIPVDMGIWSPISDVNQDQHQVQHQTPTPRPTPRLILPDKLLLIAINTNNGSKETETTKIRARKYVHGDCTYPSPSDADVGNVPGIIFKFPSYRWQQECRWGCSFDLTILVASSFTYYIILFKSLNFISFFFWICVPGPSSARGIKKIIKNYKYSPGTLSNHQARKIIIKQSFSSIFFCLIQRPGSFQKIMNNWNGKLSIHITMGNVIGSSINIGLFNTNL